jgi:hypothetical protein
MDKNETRYTNARGLRVLCLTICLLAACRPARSVIYPKISLNTTYRDLTYAQPNKESIENLIASVLASGFLKDNEATRTEIMNNQYGILREDVGATGLPRARALYVRQDDGTDAIMLSDNLFSRIVSRGFGQSGVSAKDARIEATLIHEIFHDFWFHLLDIQRRHLFSMEAQTFLDELALVDDDEEKMTFLKAAGLGDPSLDDFSAYARLLDWRNSYPDIQAYARELFAIIAAETYVGDIVVPPTLRRFYAGVLADIALNRNAIGVPS